MFSSSGQKSWRAPGTALLLLTVLLPGLLQAAEPEFSGQKAFDWLERQVAMGPRVPGSQANRQLRELILATATDLGYRATTQCLTVADPLSDAQIEICNVVVTIPGDGTSSAGRLWLGAHFDTRPIADQDPDPAQRGRPVPGANDGASGTAILLHLMEVVVGHTPPTDVNLLFFDGEDSGPSGDVNGFCLGSRHMATTWREFGSPLAGPAPRGLVLLDMVGQAGLQIPMEGYSTQYAPAWTKSVFERAGQLGLTGLVPEVGRPIYDDHVPFLGEGIAAVDLIDFDYPQWHTTADLPAACSASSLAQIGRLLVALILTP